MSSCRGFALGGGGRYQGRHAGIVHQLGGRGVLSVVDFLGIAQIGSSVLDPNSDPDPHVFGPPGSGSYSQRCGSGSFYRHANIVRKTLIPIIL